MSTPNNRPPRSGQSPEQRGLTGQLHETAERLHQHAVGATVSSLRELANGLQRVRQTLGHVVLAGLAGKPVPPEIGEQFRQGVGDVRHALGRLAGVIAVAHVGSRVTETVANHIEAAGGAPADDPPREQTPPDQLEGEVDAEL